MGVGSPHIEHTHLEHRLRRQMPEDEAEPTPQEPTVMDRIRGRLALKRAELEEVSEE